MTETVKIDRKGMRQRATGWTSTQARHFQPCGIWSPAHPAELNRHPRSTPFWLSVSKPLTDTVKKQNKKTTYSSLLVISLNFSVHGCLAALALWRCHCRFFRSASATLKVYFSNESFHNYSVMNCDRWYVKDVCVIRIYWLLFCVASYKQLSTKII